MEEVEGGTHQRLWPTQTSALDPPRTQKQTTPQIHFLLQKKEQKLILQERLEVIIGLSANKTINKWGNIDVEDISSSKLLISF